MRILRYYPELNEITGGITSTLLMLQLEYWFNKTKGKSFFKFLEPCEDEHYKVGDSWIEELGFTKAEFRTAFGKIGKVYKSKKAYKESEDKFEGKMYLSYFDRIKRLTYYIRNTEIVEKYLVLGEVDPMISRDEELGFPISVEHSKAITHKESSTPYEEIVDLFHETCEELPRVRGLSGRLRKRLDQLWKMTKGRLEVIREGFVKVQVSDFLSGRIAGKPWRASFDWIIQHDKFLEILADKYALSYSQKVDRKRPKNTRFTTMPSHNWDFEILEELEAQYIERKVEEYKQEGVSPLLWLYANK